MTKASLSCGILIMHEHSPPPPMLVAILSIQIQFLGFSVLAKAFQYGADVMIFIYCILSCVSDAEGILAS